MDNNSKPPSIAGSSTSSALSPDAPRSASAEAVLSLLRRNYIYFASLLQEPEAKWRHVSDSHGVTVTQLNSIDPTLTIYRAEATFVGVGVWDVFSTISTPGARMEWDKTLEDAVLLDDVNELSSLWHIKTKAAWPVAARDSVTIRTAYKSPSSVHIFSFSTDDDQLFPSIPPIEPPTIRTQTDLYGWAIEALSPTTTQITLLDQSDPKGWSNKSWTPNQMVAAVAGVGDFSIKFGAPPVVTRMSGAKATLSKYDHDKATLKTEYKPLPPPLTATAAGGNEEEDGKKRMIECEIRCDSNTWASNIEVVIDPPPSNVACLMRHRLSAGGGLWITISHEASAVEDDRVMVLVKKGASGREKGSVIVNGARAKVDVEVLGEDEVQLLSQRKRVKASPIPLDQYPTPSTRPARMTRVASSTPSTTTLDTQQLQQPQSPVLAPAPPPMAPPSQALEALAWLQTFHAEQGPELTDPAPGWAIVSERTGTVVRKKVIPKVSETTAVYRGDKVIQGLTAEEIASVVLAVGCRKAWDDRIESATPLATYGRGISTAVLTTKPSFPFKGRIVHLANASAQTRVPSASSTSSTSTVLFIASASYSPDDTFDRLKLNPSALQPGQILLEGWILETLDPYASSMLAIPSTRCTYVSCVDQAGSVLALSSTLNPNLAKLIANVESLAKTKGPLPRLWTPEGGLQIEGLLSDDGEKDCVWKLTETGGGVALTERVVEDYTQEDGSFRAMVKVSPELVASLTAATASNSAAAANGPTSFLSASVPVGSLSGTLPKSASLNFGTSPLLVKPGGGGGDLHRKASIGSLRLTTEGRSKSPPAASVVTVGTQAQTPTSSRTQPVTAVSHDLVVAELVVDLKQFPNGYSISCSSALLPTDKSELLSLEPLTSLGARQVPVRATAHDAPLPSILSASLDSWKRQQHLVRLLVPTGAITHPVKDPLRDDATKEEAKPEWFTKLQERGALIEVKLVRLPEDGPLTTAGGKGESRLRVERVMFNGERLEVQSQTESRGVLGRLEDEDAPPTGTKISRVPRKKKTQTTPAAAAAVIGAGSTAEAEASAANTSTLPPQFEKPLAIALRLLAPVPSSPTPSELEFPDPKSPGTTTPAQLEGVNSPNLTSNNALLDSVVAGGAKNAVNNGAAPLVRNGRSQTTSSDGTGSQLLGILGAYPLSRLSSSMRVASASDKDRDATATTSTVGASPQVLLHRSPSSQGYSLRVLVLVAVISFLLGSLLRSLLTPADYIIYRPISPSQSLGFEKALHEAFEPGRRWREARRLVEMRTYWFSKWDLIIAAVRRAD